MSKTHSRLRLSYFVDDQPNFTLRFVRPKTWRKLVLHDLSLSDAYRELPKRIGKQNPSSNIEKANTVELPTLVPKEALKSAWLVETTNIRKHWIKLEIENFQIFVFLRDDI